MKIVLGLALVFILSCTQPQNSGGSASAVQTAFLSGTWNLTSVNCSGESISIGDMTETFTVIGSTMSIKDSSAGADCAVTSNNIALTADGQKVVTSGGDGAFCSKVNCVPSQANNFCKVPSCQIPFIIGGIQVAYSCPLNFPVFLYGSVTYSTSGNNLVRTVSLPGDACLYTYSH